MSRRSQTPAPRKRSPGQGYVTEAGDILVSALVPIPYITILDREAALFGLKRSQFLEMLLRARRGLVKLERPDAAPRYEFKAKEFEEAAKVVWLMKPNVKALWDEDRLLLGTMDPAPWVITVVNHWIGSAQGFERARNGTLRSPRRSRL